MRPARDLETNLRIWAVDFFAVRLIYTLALYVFYGKIIFARILGGAQPEGVWNPGIVHVMPLVVASIVYGILLSSRLCAVIPQFGWQNTSGCARFIGGRSKLWKTRERWAA